MAIEKHSELAETPAWLTIARAFERMGVLEVPGQGAHPLILAFFQFTDQRTRKAAQSDETAWCSAFACACMELAGVRSPRSMAARSWSRWGRQAELQPGAVVVLKRPNAEPWQGHVGLVSGMPDKAGRFYVLGGNQKNRVCVKRYNTADVIAVRMPKAS